MIRCLGVSEESQRPKPPEEPKPSEVLHSDDLPQILKRNPHNFWLHPFLWWRWNRTEVLYQNYTELRVGLDDWERQWLIPQLKGRIGFITKLLNDIKAVCANRNVRTQLGPAIAKLGAAPPNVDSRVLADDYLNQVASQVDSDFLKVINDANEQAEHVNDLRSLVRFANTVRFVASQITSTESTLFWYSTWIHPIVVNKHTGQPIRSETAEE